MCGGQRVGAWLKDAAQGGVAVWLREGVLCARPALARGYERVLEQLSMARRTSGTCATRPNAVLSFQEMPRLRQSARSCICAHIILRKAVFGTRLLGICLAFPSSIPLSPTF